MADRALIDQLEADLLAELSSAGLLPQSTQGGSVSSSSIIEKRVEKQRQEVEEKAAQIKAEKEAKAAEPRLTITEAAKLEILVAEKKARAEKLKMNNLTNLDPLLPVCEHPSNYRQMLHRLDNKQKLAEWHAEKEKQAAAMKAATRFYVDTVSGKKRHWSREADQLKRAEKNIRDSLFVSYDSFIFGRSELESVAFKNRYSIQYQKSIARWAQSFDLFQYRMLKDDPNAQPAENEVLPESIFDAPAIRAWTDYLLANPQTKQSSLKYLSEVHTAKTLRGLCPESARTMYKQCCQDCDKSILRSQELAHLPAHFAQIDSANLDEAEEAWLGCFMSFYYTLARPEEIPRWERTLYGNSAVWQLSGGWKHNQRSNVENQKASFKLRLACSCARTEYLGLKRRKFCAMHGASDTELEAFRSMDVEEIRSAYLLLLQKGGIANPDQKCGTQLRKSRNLYSLRVGGSQSCLLGGVSVELLAKYGRWSNTDTAWLYAGLSGLCSPMEKTFDWPLFRPSIVDARGCVREGDVCLAITDDDNNAYPDELVARAAGPELMDLS